MSTAHAILTGPTLSSTSKRRRLASGVAEFLGIQFDGADMAHVARQIGDRAPSAAFAYVVTPNVDHVVRLHRVRSDLWPAYRGAWLTLCDSRILGRLAAWAGVRLSIVPGSDLTAALFAGVIRSDDRIALLGGSAACVDTLRQRYGLTRLIHHNPPMGFINDAQQVDRAVAFLIEARARYCILAVGSPQQEVLAYRLSRLGSATGIGLCVGASLDFLTGAQTRAPRLVQLFAMEWLFRLLSSPARMARRYLVDGPMIVRIFQDWRHRHHA